MRLLLLAVESDLSVPEEFMDEKTLGNEQSTRESRSLHKNEEKAFALVVFVVLCLKCPYRPAGGLAGSGQILVEGNDEQLLGAGRSIAARVVCGASPGI